MPLAARMDWASLEVKSGSFVKQNLLQTHSDLLFSARIEETPCLLHLIFEHQTTVDERMPLRLLGYTMQILRKHEETQGLPLQPVLSFVLHHGRDRWTVSPCFEDLFALPDSLRDLLLPYLPKFQHLLLDLSQHDPASEERSMVNRVLLGFMKQVRNRKILEFFLGLDQQQPRTPLDLLRLCLLYLWNVRELDPEAITRKLRQRCLKEEILTTAARLKAEGRAEGRAEGKAIGKLKVMQEMMSLSVSSDEELERLGLEELERRFAVLQRQYEVEFKRQ